MGTDSSLHEHAVDNFDLSDVSYTTRIHLLETSALWPLLNPEDNLHNAVKKKVSALRLDDIVLLPTVQIEYQARFNRLFGYLLTKIIIEIETQRAKRLDLATTNKCIDEGARKHMNDPNTPKNINYSNLIALLHQYVRRFYQSNQENNMSKMDLKSLLTTVRETFTQPTIEVLKFLSNMGHVLAEVTPDVSKKINEFFTGKYNPMNGIADILILKEMIGVTLSMSDEFVILLCDNEFFKKGSIFVDSLANGKLKWDLIEANGVG